MRRAIDAGREAKKAYREAREVLPRKANTKNLCFLLKISTSGEVNEL